MRDRSLYKPDAPSVTELLKWVGYYDNYPNHSYHLERGNTIEAWATDLLQGQLHHDTRVAASEIRTTASGSYEQWIDYIDGFADWMSHHQIKFIGSQIYVYNPWCTYQGTLDWLLEIDGELTVVDCKTGSCPKVTALQIAGYDMALSNFLEGTFTPEVVDALRAWGLKKPRKRLGLQLEPGKCTPHPYDKFSRDNDVFRNLVSCWWMHGPQSREYR